MAVYGCLRALTTAVVAVMVAVRDTSRPSARKGGESPRLAGPRRKPGLEKGAGIEGPFGYRRAQVVTLTCCRPRGVLRISKRCDRTYRVICLDRGAKRATRRRGYMADVPQYHSLGQRVVGV